MRLYPKEGLCALPPRSVGSALLLLESGCSKGVRDPKAKWMSVLLPRLNCVLESLGDLI